MINQLQTIMPSTNELSKFARPSLFWARQDPMGIGYNPTTNQAEAGTPRQSIWGALARLIPKSGFRLDSSIQPYEAAVYPNGNFFPTFPFRGIRDYTGRQAYGAQPSEQLYASLRGYRGILPINQLPLINKPYPYTIPVYEQFGRA